MKRPDLHITLVYASAPRTVHEDRITVPAGSSARDALERAGWLVRFPEIPSNTLGIWGRVSSPQTGLRDGDRLEVYRPLRVDPKVARRERFVGQGARGAGLFNRRRPGSKAGY
ncbi:MAG: RnfH family protein [Hydrogenophaga sp.]|jgi:putative ubiquitin-RnfH superfamily antitoxin RatB of RatAB toxin-antitoxin module|nr:RnfH family protein [Hydrogenophaga sp.]